MVSLLTQGCSTTCLPKPKPVCLGEMKTSKENKHIHLLYNQSGQEHFLFFVFKRELSKMSVCQLNKRDHLPCKLNSFAMLGCEIAVALDLPGVAFLTISDLTLGVGGWDCRFPMLNGCVCCSVPDLCVVGASKLSSCRALDGNERRAGVFCTHDLFIVNERECAVLTQIRGERFAVSTIYSLITHVCVRACAHVHVGGRRVPWHVCGGLFPGVSFVLLPLDSRDWTHVPRLGVTSLHMPSLRHSPAISLGVLNVGDLRPCFGILREY